MSLLWQPRAYSSSVPSKACQTSSTSYGNSPRVGKQEHPVIVGAVRLDLTQHHLCKGSCSAVGPSPSFTQYVDIIRILKDIPQVSALVDSGATSSDALLSHGGETHLRVSQSQVAEIVT